MTPISDELDIDNEENDPEAALIPISSESNADFDRYPVTYNTHAWPGGHLWSSARRRPQDLRLCRLLRTASGPLLIAFVVLVSICGAFFPSYTHLPPHYRVLQQRAMASSEPGRANIHNQKIYIAVSIYDTDGRLLTGQWSRDVLEVVQLLGPDNTFLSVYLNGPGLKAKAHFDEFARHVPCKHKLIYEERAKTDDLPHLIFHGEARIKRIEFLAAVRNRALLPLSTSEIMFDKVLFLNDIYFHPIEAMQLIFSTHTVDGTAEYRAACAIDFDGVLTPFKFYDTYATRDAAGYGMGANFFPWFARGGDTRSQDDVLAGSDAVRVRSCWGGMVSFDARYLQRQSSNPELITAGNQGPMNLTVPFRFRAELAPYWEASECCLIHADIQSPEPGNSGIFLNPFVRTAYDPITLSSLALTRRFERLLLPIHSIVDFALGRPATNPRLKDIAQQVGETIWVPNGVDLANGSWQIVKRTASHANFCGKVGLAVVKQHESGWEALPVPAGRTEALPEHATKH